MSQQKDESYEITGQVSAYMEKPLNGVEIVAKKSKKTTPDSIGHLTLRLDKKDNLVIRVNRFSPYVQKICDQISEPILTNLIIQEDLATRAIENGYISAEDYNYAELNLANKNYK